MLTVELGALADPLSSQLASVIKDEATLRRLDIMANGITSCVVNELISVSVGDLARKKLLQKIKAAIQAEQRER